MKYIMRKVAILLLFITLVFLNGSFGNKNYLSIDRITVYDEVGNEINGKIKEGTELDLNSAAPRLNYYIVKRFKL